MSYVHIVEYYSAIEKNLQCSDTCYNMDEPWKHTLKWKKAHIKHYILQADLGDIEGLVPDHYNEASIAVKWVTWIFWFPNAYKVMFTLYWDLLSVQ